VVRSVNCVVELGVCNENVSYEKREEKKEIRKPKNNWYSVTYFTHARQHSLLDKGDRGGYAARDIACGS